MPRRKKDFFEKDVLDPLTNENPEPAPFKPTPSVKRRFVSNTYPHLSLGIKGRLYYFVNGALETTDPAVIAAVENHPWFKIHIHRG